MIIGLFFFIIYIIYNIKCLFLELKNEFKFKIFWRYLVVFLVLKGYIMIIREFSKIKKFYGYCFSWFILSG